MISLNDVLLAMSNIPVGDPIAEIWGRGLQSGYKIIEYTGTLPIAINANGDALLDYRIYGADGGVGEQTENLFEVESDMLSSLNWSLNPSYNVSGNPFFINYKLSDTVAQELKTGQHTCSIFRHFTDGYIPKELVCAFTQTTTAFVNEKYRILTNNGITYDRTFDFSEWQDIYLIIGYSKSFSTEQIKQLKIDELFANWEISIVEGSTAPTEYEPYGYKLPMVISDGNTVQTVPVYIGENKLNRNEYVSFSEQKIYRDDNGTLTPTDSPVPLPEIPTIKGKTVIDYDGTPKPSQMYVKYKGKE